MNFNELISYRCNIDAYQITPKEYSDYELSEWEANDYVEEEEAGVIR